jgi:hypothetical protein
LTLTPGFGLRLNSIDGTEFPLFLAGAFRALSPTPVTRNHAAQGLRSRRARPCRLSRFTPHLCSALLPLVACNAPDRRHRWRIRNGRRSASAGVSRRCRATLARLRATGSADEAHQTMPKRPVGTRVCARACVREYSRARVVVPLCTLLICDSVEVGLGLFLPLVLPLSFDLRASVLCIHSSASLRVRLCMTSEARKPSAAERA